MSGLIDTIYIEEAIKDHPRATAISQRFPAARLILCERYGEIFNRKAQNFRLQKQRPALILAEKYKNFVLPAPQGYAVGGEKNYYFSHMLNCVYDCRYCFLQGMYRSANYVVFVNFEEFDSAIEDVLQQCGQETTWFFSGYDCDSMALEPVTGFIEHMLATFPKNDRAFLELRTKSTQVRCLLATEPRPNWVIAYSFSPPNIAASLEHKAPTFERRLDAIVRLQKRGWRVGLRFDPLLYHDDYKTAYLDMFEQIFQRINVDMLHSVSLGAFRMPSSFFRNSVRLYPHEKLFAGPLTEKQGMVSYNDDLEMQLLNYCSAQLMNYIPESMFYPCTI